MVTSNPDPTELQDKLQIFYNRYMASISPPVRETKYKCGRCHEIQQKESYYKSLNPFMYYKRIGICSNCVAKVVKFDNYVEAQFFLSLIYYPFFEPLWMTALEKVDPIKYYIDMIVSAQYDSLRVLSIDEIIKGETPDSKVKEEKFLNRLDKLPKIAEEKKIALEKRWGDNYNTLEYLKLEDYYNNMIKDYDIKTTAHKDYLIKITKTSYAMDLALANGDYTTYKNLSGIFDTLMKSANLADAKSKENRRDNTYNAFGLLFETVEKRGFIPKYHDVEDPDIVDKTIKNLKSWTKQLIEGDSDLNALIESAAQRLLDDQITLKTFDEYDGVEGLDSYEED